MPSQPPTSRSDGIVDPAAERSVDGEVQARREEIALGISRYLAGVCVAVSLLLVVLWLLPPHYPQILIYAVLNLLLALAAWLFPVFQRRNRTTVGLYFVFGVSLVIVLCGPLLLPSLMPAVGIWDVTAMMVAILLLDDRRSRGLVGAFALAYMVDVVAVAILGWSLFPPMEHRIELWVSGAVSLGIMLAAILIIRRIVLGLGQQFRRAQRLNFDLERQNHAVTETQAALTEERNLLRTLIDTVPANVYIKDAQSRFVDANTETIHKFGATTSNDLIGKTDFDFFTPELAAKYFADDQIVLQSGQPLLNIEEPTVDQRTQQTVWLLTTKAPIRNEQGEITGLVGVGLDMTDRKQAQEEIAQERDLLRTLIDHLPDYIFVKDADRRFVNSNAAHNRVAGVKDAADLFGKSAFDVFPQPLAAQFEADDRQVLQSGQALVNVERTSVDAEGRERTVLTTKVPLHDTSGKVTGLVGISRDITERKLAEAQAFALTAEQQRGRLLREFITDVSHDFRTPLTIIGTSAFLVSKTTDPVKLTHYSQRIEEQISRLGLLMDNFVEFAHVEQQTSPFQFQPADLDQLMTTIVERSKQGVDAKHQHLDYSCETDAALVLGDPTVITQAITHVVINAIRYTPDEGKITLRLYRDGESAVIEVADTGVGVQAADLPHIFDSFYRTDSARSMGSGGAGLGLSIAKKIIELMKGHIEVESEFGTGSIFKIYLPIYQ